MSVFHTIIRKMFNLQVVIVTYFVFSITTGIYISCPFRALTGLRCPGCGITHMVLYLLKGRVITAFACNPAFMIYLLYLASIMVLARIYHCKRFIFIHYYAGRILNWHYTHWNFWCLFMVSWGIVRNIFGV